jgi:hypothetical protein
MDKAVLKGDARKTTPCTYTSLVCRSLSCQRSLLSLLRLLKDDVGFVVVI